MGAFCTKALVRIALGLILIASGATATSGADQNDTVSGLILTIDGRLAQGELTGILPTVRLDASGLTNSVGPIQAFDIPREEIRQITLHFPRMVVETKDRVFVGPFSAYSGISQLLFLNREIAGFAIPTTSVRAIALHGHALQPVPREWLGSTFLYMPLSSTMETARAEAYEVPRISPTPSERPPAPAAAEAEPESPQWVLLLILGVIGVFVVVSLLFGRS